jgi:predicted DNA-binding transcriptional regulator YafY
VLLFSRLLRDADKLDIWRLTLDQNVAFTIRNEKEPESYRIPEPILNRIREGRVVLVPFAESMNDFRLLRLSWVFDMNFPATFSIIEKKGSIEKILARIPEFPEKKEISAILHSYCRSRRIQAD